MAIYEQDIKLLESQRLTDNEDGGGRITGHEIIDGEANNIFPDISSLDRVYGRVNLRKAYPAILTPNTDTYYGSHLIIADPPEDPNVHVTLFDTEDWTDQRANSRQRIEAYVVMGPEMRGYLLGTQYEGQRQITVLQRLDAPVPEIGTTMVLDLDEDGYTPHRQYIRITGVEHAEVEYEDDRGVYIRRRVLMDISEPLRNDFPGNDPSRTRSSGSLTTVRETRVADAARYYGVTPLADPATQGDLTIKCDRIYTPLVPSTQAESPLTDEPAAAAVEIPLESGGETVTATDVAQTGEIPITLATRRYNYIFACLPRPAPGTLSVSYRSQGRWYDLRDNGSGQLEGVGTGTVDYNTGTVQVTLAELPDVPSSILLAWGAGGINYNDRAGVEGDIDPFRVTINTNTPMQPQTVTVTWLVDGVTKTATDAGVSPAGTLQGDATGRINYVDGVIYLEPDINNIPDYDSVVQVEGDEAATQTVAIDPDVQSDGTTTIDIGQQIQPGTLTLKYTEQDPYWRFNMLADEEDDSKQQVVVTDDGLGNLVGATGMVDYTNGIIQVEVERKYVRETANSGSYWVPEYTELPESYSTDTRSRTYVRGPDAMRFGDTGNDGYFVQYTGTYRSVRSMLLVGSIMVEFYPPGVMGDTVTVQVPAPEVSGNLLGLVRETIVPGTVRFRWRGEIYEDRDGELVYNPDSSGFGPVAGSINYNTGEVSMTRWGTGSQELSVQRMVTSIGAIATNNITFRVVGAPLRNQSLIVQAMTPQGDLLTIQGDANGVLSDPTGRTNGKVDWETGVVRLEFGQWIDGEFQQEFDAGPDGDPADESVTILPGSVRFSAVVFRSIPLDADLLGLDPVRLPSDGRVPFVRPGNVAVIHNTQTTDIGDGAVTTTLRPRLTYCHVYDSEGERLTDDRLTVDLDAGTVEVLDPSGHTPPFTAEHRIEDMRLVSEVQITGYVSLASALTHDYPADGTYLSTALLYGDLQAGWIDPWAQTTWNNVWSDEPQGDSPTATLNTTDYPIVVTNEGAIQERWLLRFVSTAAVNVIGEYTGQILTNISINEDIAPTNPNTGVPYFTIPKESWGGGWSTGNAVRFNTRAANRPVWIARTVLASDETTDSDQFRLQIRGDAQ